MSSQTHQNGDLRSEPLGKLVQDFLDESKRVVSEGSRLLRTEIDSAKAEVSRAAGRLGPAAALGGAGGVLAHAAVLMLAVSLAALLAQAMSPWLAFLLTAAVLGAASATLLYLARNKAAAVKLIPTHTLRKLEEDRRWTRGLTQNVRSNLQRST